MYIICWNRGFYELVGDIESVVRVAEILELSETEFKISNRDGGLKQTDFGFEKDYLYWVEPEMSWSD